MAADGVNSKVRSLVFGDYKPQYIGSSVWRYAFKRPAELETGYMFMGKKSQSRFDSNDWTARALQKVEMAAAPLGPHKGKDFANAIGPCIVTKDEFEQYRCTISREMHPEHLRIPLSTGDRFDVKMTAKINGQTICEGNFFLVIS